MSFEAFTHIPPVDDDLVDKILGKIKSQGIFDQFRKDCLADVDTKPAYQNLQERVNGTVQNFLDQHPWSGDLNKNQLRESLRRHVQQGFLEVGVDRIVDQVVNPKIYSVFLPKVEDIVYSHLGIEKPKTQSKLYTQSIILAHPPPPIKPPSPTVLAPKELDSISIGSGMADNPTKKLRVELPKEKTKEEDESPAFEPLSAAEPMDEVSTNSHLSGISELTCHGSIKLENSDVAPPTIDASNGTSELNKESEENQSDNNFCNLSEKIKASGDLNHIGEMKVDIEDSTMSEFTGGRLKTPEHDLKMKEETEESSSVATESLHAVHIDSEIFIQRSDEESCDVSTFEAKSHTEVIGPKTPLGTPTPCNEESFSQFKDPEDSRSSAAGHQSPSRLLDGCKHDEKTGSTPEKGKKESLPENENSLSNLPNGTHDIKDDLSKPKSTSHSERHRSDSSRHHRSKDSKSSSRSHDKHRRDESKDSRSHDKSRHESSKSRDDKSRSSRDKDKSSSSRSKDDSKRKEDKHSDRHRDDKHRDKSSDKRSSDKKDSRKETERKDTEKKENEKKDDRKDSSHKRDVEKREHHDKKESTDKNELSDKKEPSDKRDSKKESERKHDGKESDRRRDRKDTDRKDDKRKESSRSDEKEKHRDDKERSKDSKSKAEKSSRDDKSKSHSSDKKSEDLRKKERDSRKRKGERCSDDVRSKEARRSSDRDSSGQGSGKSRDNDLSQEKNKERKSEPEGKSETEGKEDKGGSTIEQVEMDFENSSCYDLDEIISKIHSKVGKTVGPLRVVSVDSKRKVNEKKNNIEDNTNIQLNQSNKESSIIEDSVRINSLSSEPEKCNEPEPEKCNDSEPEKCNDSEPEKCNDPEPEENQPIEVPKDNSEEAVRQEGIELPTSATLSDSDSEDFQGFQEVELANSITSCNKFKDFVSRVLWDSFNTADGTHLFKGITHKEFLDNNLNNLSSSGHEKKKGVSVDISPVPCAVVKENGAQRAPADVGKKGAGSGAKTGIDTSDDEYDTANESSSGAVKDSFSPSLTDAMLNNLLKESMGDSLTAGNDGGDSSVKKTNLSIYLKATAHKQPVNSKETGDSPPLQKGATRLTRSSQRYDSTDLYKPRPSLSHPSKRKRSSRSDSTQLPESDSSLDNSPEKRRVR